MISLSIINQTFASWIRSAVSFAAVLFLGFLLKRILARVFGNVVSKTHFALYDEKIVAMVNSYVSFWVILLAFYIAFLSSPYYNGSAVCVGVNKLFYIIFASSVVIFIASIIPELLQKLTSKKVRVNIIKFIIIFIGLALIINRIGIKLMPIWAAMGMGVLPAAFVIKDILSSFYAGLNILASKQIVKGDYIKVDSDHEGTVIEISWRTTLIRSISNTVIVVPNVKLLSTTVTSFHFHSSEVTGSVDCRVAYGSNLEHVEKVAVFSAQEIINGSEDTIKTYTPIVRFIGFSDYSIIFSLFFRVKSVYSKAFVQSEILKKIYKNFNAEKIKVSSVQK
jgi:small-conductance mechanosensitive channel